MIDIAKQIIGQMEGKFDPSDFKDRYEDALRALIKSKEGTAKSPSQPETTSDDNVIDLMAALQKSLAGADKPKKSAPARKKAARKAG
jgi:DNA end-binding protein Ku